MIEEQLDWLGAYLPCTPEIASQSDNPPPAEPGLAPVLLTRSDRASNMHRFYSLELATSLFGERGVVRQWGRIRTSGRSRTDWYDDPHEAESAFQDLLKAKQRRGYAP